MATFENYDEDKAFWFLVYLQLAEIICKHPRLSAKNSSFDESVEDFLDKYFEEKKRKTYGFFY